METSMALLRSLPPSLQCPRYLSCTFVCQTPATLIFCGLDLSVFSQHKNGGWSRCLCICVFCLYIRIWMQIHFGLSSLVWKILSDVLACPYISEVWVCFMPVKLDYLMPIKCRIFRRDLFIFSGVSLCFCFFFFSSWSSSQAFPACLPLSFMGAGPAWSAGGQHGCTLPGKV